MGTIDRFPNAALFFIRLEIQPFSILGSVFATLLGDGCGE